MKQDISWILNIQATIFTKDIMLNSIIPIHVIVVSALMSETQHCQKEIGQMKLNKACLEWADKAVH